MDPRTGLDGCGKGVNGRIILKWDRWLQMASVCEHDSEFSCCIKCGIVLV